MDVPSDPATVGDVVLIGANGAVVGGEDQPEHRGGGEASVRFFGFRRLCPQVRAIGNGSELVACDPFQTLSCLNRQFYAATILASRVSFDPEF